MSDQLGYPQQIEEISPRFLRILKDSKQKILVSEENGQVIAWIHFGEGNSLVDPPHIEIRGLVVDEQTRSRGIGGEMMSAVEEHTKRIGYGLIRFSSNIKRERAHKLYLSLGYEIQKTSYKFVKKII